MGVIIVNSRTRPSGGLSMAISISTIFCDAERQIRKSVRGFFEIYGAFTVEYESYSILMVFSQVQLNRRQGVSDFLIFSALSHHGQLAPTPLIRTNPRNVANFCVARYLLGIPREICFERGSTCPEALTQAIRLSGIMTRMETRRDAQRMSEMAQCLPAASTNTLPRDNGATTRRFPPALAA